jgi:hypothetical protein
MSQHLEADVLIWIGALGLLEFGGLLLAGKVVDSEFFAHAASGRGPDRFGQVRWPRTSRWARFVPLMIAISLAALVVGALLRWVLVS